MEQQTKTSARALGAALKPRQLTMMGLGSAIGAGLFIGSGAGIQAAGPAVLISYLVAGTLIILVMWALGEMAAANPDSGAFSVYTAKAYGPVAGATVGWLWWLQLVVVIAAEALGAAGLLATIFPALPVWLMAFVFIVVLTAVNLTADARLPLAHGPWSADPGSDLHGGLHRRGLPSPAPQHLWTRGTAGGGELGQPPEDGCSAACQIFGR